MKNLKLIRQTLNATTKSLNSFLVVVIALTLAANVQRAAAQASAGSATALDTRFIAVKTNALVLASTVFNIGVELQTGSKWSVDLPFYYSPYNLSSTRKLRVMAIQPELRYWPDGAGEGLFIGCHASVVGFNIALNDHGRYQDPDRPLWEGGIGWGYAATLDKAKRWAVEFNMGLGYADYKYDVYYNQHNGVKFKSGSDHYVGITRLGVTFTYRWQLPHKTK